MKTLLILLFISFIGCTQSSNTKLELGSNEETLPLTKKFLLEVSKTAYYNGVKNGLYFCIDHKIDYYAGWSRDSLWIENLYLEFTLKVK